MAPTGRRTPNSHPRRVHTMASSLMSIVMSLATPAAAHTVSGVHHQDAKTPTETETETTRTLHRSSFNTPPRNPKPNPHRHSLNPNPNPNPNPHPNPRSSAFMSTHNPTSSSVYDGFIMHPYVGVAGGYFTASTAAELLTANSVVHDYLDLYATNVGTTTPLLLTEWGIIGTTQGTFAQTVAEASIFMTMLDLTALQHRVNIVQAGIHILMGGGANGFTLFAYDAQRNVTVATPNGVMYRRLVQLLVNATVLPTNTTSPLLPSVGGHPAARGVDVHAIRGRDNVVRLLIVNKVGVAMDIDATMVHSMTRSRHGTATRVPDGTSHLQRDARLHRNNTNIVDPSTATTRNPQSQHHGNPNSNTNLNPNPHRDPNNNTNLNPNPTTTLTLCGMEVFVQPPLSWANWTLDRVDDAWVKVPPTAGTTPHHAGRHGKEEDTTVVVGGGGTYTVPAVSIAVATLC
eukprot:m.125802 g.125802  ORF g.125802 m.125802 type:complete len:458 (+) comp11176_c4_seq6:76-1449(+)